MPAQPCRRPAGPQTAAALRSAAPVALSAARDQTPRVHQPEAQRASPPRSPSHRGLHATLALDRAERTYLGALPRIPDRVIHGAIDVGHEVLIDRCPP